MVAPRWSNGTPPAPAGRSRASRSPTARATPVSRTARSAHQRVDQVGAEADLLVVLLADLDVVVHIEEVLDLAVLVEPDQRALDLEVDLHRLVGLVGDERVGLARGLVDEGAGGRDPVVLEVAPLARDRVGEDLVGVVVAVDEAGPRRHQHVAPAVLGDRDPDRPGADGLAQGHVVALVVGRDVRGEHLGQRVLLEDLLDRLQVTPELGAGLGVGHSLLLVVGGVVPPRQRPWSRSSRRRIFPVAVFGTSSMISTWRGYLYAAIRSLQKAISSSAPADSPSFSETNALTVSPRYSSGTPTTAASRTAGWPESTSSTSRGQTL